MEFATAVVGEIAKEVSNSLLYRVKRHAGYILDRKKNVADLKAKVEDLNDKRERVEHDVQAAKRNEEEIAADVNRWLERVGEFMEKNAEEVKALEDQAMNRCFMCCPNVKSYHQLGKKAEEHAGVIEKLLQANFDSVGYRRAPELIVKVPGDYYNFQSRSNLLEGITNALTNPDVKVIGLHGLPGVGKTMLVNVVARKAWEARMFDEVVIATVSHNPNIRSIQEEIAEQLGLRFDNVKKESGRAKLLSQRLSGGKKILVILDDIWDKMDLDDIGISFKDDKNITCSEKAGSTIENISGSSSMDTSIGRSKNISGSSSMDTSIGRSKILLTSRRSDVMDQMNAEMKFECEYLSRKEAMELFASIVGSAVVTNLAYNSKANQLVEKCGGLPVAVSTIANAMKNTSPDVWENALIELKRLNPENIDKMRSVYSIIELSYQLLKSEEAQSFLELCALEGQASNILLSDLLKYGLGMQLFKHVKNLEEARIRLSALVHKLKASSLLLGGKYDETVKMHDLVRDVSLSIVSKEKQMIVIEDDTHFLSLRREGELANCTAISLPHSDVHQLPSVLECPKLKLLLLFSKDKFQLQVPDLFFEKTNDLRVLDLTGMHFPSLPSSFPCLTNLRTLCLDQCKLGTITSIAKLKKLDILSFLSSEIMQLPNEIGELTELRMLDLSNCSNLEVIPANTLSKLSCLEELYMGNSFDRWDVEGNARLTELRNLKHLTTLHVHVRDAQFLPEDVFPETLGRYRIFLGDIPWDWLNKHKYSRTLKLKVTTRINLDRGIRTLIRKAEELYVDELEGLRIRSLLYELDDTGFQDLKNLQVKNNSGIQYIINSSHGISSEAFPLVESLLLHDLINLRKIFHGQVYSECFRRLRTIEVRNCDSLKNLFSLSLATHFLQQLQEIEVSDCSAIVDILGADRETANQEAIVLGELQSITLQSLPNLVSFYFGEEKHSTSHHGQVASTLSSLPLFSKEIEFPKLQKLKLCSINIEIIWHSQYQLQTSIQNLTSLIIEGCDNLKHILSYSMVNWLQQLQVFEIINCKRIREIIATEETTVYGNRATSFFPCLKILRIEDCPELKGFINKSSSEDISSDNTNEVVLFSEEVAFPNLERLTISHLRNVKWIWYNNQPHAYSGSKLKELRIEYCDALLNVLPSSVLGAFQSLEMLEVTDCSSLEEVFDIKETCSATMQLRLLNLDRLPKLKHVWNKDPHGNTISFKDLRHVDVFQCWSLKSLFPFSIAKGLQQLESLSVSNCGVEEIISKNITNSEGLEQETTRFEFNMLSSLTLWNLPDLKCFYLGMHTTIWPKLKYLRTFRCERKIKIFRQPNAEPQIQQPLLLIDEVIPQLEEVYFSFDDITMICNRQCPPYFFSHIKVLGINFYHNESTAFPFHFLQRFHNLEQLLPVSFAFKDLSPYKGDFGEEKCDVLTLPKIKRLRFKNASRIRHLWDEDSPMGRICANLETLEVWNCDNLINLGPSSASFQNLTTLDVWNCNGMAELITSTKAQSLVHLVTMRIRECEMMKAVVASDEGRDDGDITFPELKVLELHCLHSLESFCYGNYIFKFPSLVQVTVSQCPSLKIFCPSAALSTPKLLKVHLKDTDTKGRWLGNLNVTIQQLHKEKVLKLSNINPELVEIWNKNPQEIVDFKNLEVLEVCNTNNLRCILNLSMASSLSRLQELQIKRCNNLEAVIMEEEATETTDDKITIFPLLKSIVIEDCPDLKSFYWGSPSLIEFPALAYLEVSHCQNMASFISKFSTDKDKQAIIAEENNDLTSFFCYKVAFPNLETLKISHLRNLKWIWCDQLHGNTSFSIQNLKFVEVEECWSLKSVFPFSIAKGLQQLQELSCSKCGVEEIISKDINSEGSEQEIRFEFNQLLLLELWDLPYLKCFYPGMHNATWPALKWLHTYGCEKKIKIFGQPGDAESQIQQPLFRIDEVIPQLEDVSFSSDDISMICAGQFVDDFFYHIKQLGVTSYLNESAYFPFGFLQRFSNLIWLGVYDSNFKELSPCKRYDDGEEKQVCITLPKISHLRLRRLYKITHLWNEDSPMGHICSNLETLQVWECDSLISLGSSSASFQNLTTLYVWKCNGIAELITSSKAQSLVNLVKMKIRECEMMKQVVASNEGDNDDDEATSEITFPKLECLELDCLQSLESFCSGNYIFKFPSLEQVFVIQCPSMKSFCHGALSTPKLRKVQLKKTDYEGRWGGDLNATIQQIAQLSE